MSQNNFYDSKSCFFIGYVDFFDNKFKTFIFVNYYLKLLLKDLIEFYSFNIHLRYNLQQRLYY